MVNRRVILTREEFEQLPTYSTSLPTWGKHNDGKLLGVTEWKRQASDCWLLGKATLIDDAVQIDWYIIDTDDALANTQESGQ